MYLLTRVSCFFGRLEGTLPWTGARSDDEIAEMKAKWGEGKGGVWQYLAGEPPARVATRGRLAPMYPNRAFSARRFTNDLLLLTSNLTHFTLHRACVRRCCGL